jgi:hypothetical protein
MAAGGAFTATLLRADNQVSFTLCQNATFYLTGLITFIENYPHLVSAFPYANGLYCDPAGAPLVS